MSALVADPSISKASAEGRFLLFDGLRGVAAFAVILDHVPSELGDLVPGRALSVDFFFALSGFVLAHAYGGKLKAGWSPWAFMRARLIRLYPLYLAGTLIGIALAAWTMIKGWPNAPTLAQLLTFGALALLFLPQPPTSAYAGAALYPFNGPAWSLFFELAVNLVYGLLARFLSLRVLLVLLPVAAAALALSVFKHPDVRGPGWLWPHLDAGLGRTAFAFLAGTAIYRLREVVRLPSIPWWAAVLVFLLIIAMPVGSQSAPAYDAFAATVLMPLLIMFACNAKVSGVAARLCAASGLLSYGVYVLHVPLYGVLQLVFGALRVELPHSALSPVLVAVMAATAAIVLHWAYDLPVRTWLGRVFSRSKKDKKRHVPMRKKS